MLATHYPLLATDMVASRDNFPLLDELLADQHSLHALVDGERGRPVGPLPSTGPAHPFPQTVTAACPHCANPACLNGCPVLAFEKDPLTGIVLHLDDQCIGCNYCVLKCPYDVP